MINSKDDRPRIIDISDHRVRISPLSENILEIMQQIQKDGAINKNHD